MYQIILLLFKLQHLNFFVFKIPNRCENCRQGNAPERWSLQNIPIG